MLLGQPSGEFGVHASDKCVKICLDFWIYPNLVYLFPSQPSEQVLWDDSFPVFIKNIVGVGQQRGSTAAMQMELERLRSELRRALNNGQQWQQLHQELYCFCVDELMGGNKERDEDEDKDGEKDKEKDKEKARGGRGKVVDKMREK